MKKEKKIIAKLIVKYIKEVDSEYNWYFQFTIDTFKKFQMDFLKATDDSKVELFVETTYYKIENILQIIKEGKDRDLFSSFYKEMKKGLNKQKQV